MNTRLTVVTACVAVMVCTVDAYPCKTALPVSNVDMVQKADAIVRATAEDYALAPRNPVTWTDLGPDSRIRFKVLEVVRGKIPADHLVLPVFLSTRMTLTTTLHPTTPFALKAGEAVVLPAPIVPVGSFF